MDTGNLIRMANRIGEFFEPMPDREEALDGIASHLRRYWAPPMRRALFARLDADTPPDAGEAVLMPIVREAVLAHRAALGG